MLVQSIVRRTLGLNAHCVKKVTEERGEMDVYLVPNKRRKPVWFLLWKERAWIRHIGALHNDFLARECGGAYFDLVKIDVEGAEESVIEGLVDIDWKFMYIELSYQRRGAIGLNEFLSLLKKQMLDPRL